MFGHFRQDLIWPDTGVFWFQCLAISQHRVQFTDSPLFNFKRRQSWRKGIFCWLTQVQCRQTVRLMLDQQGCAPGAPAICSTHDQPRDTEEAVLYRFSRLDHIAWAAQVWVGPTASVASGFARDERRPDSHWVCHSPGLRVRLSVCWTSQSTWRLCVAEPVDVCRDATLDAQCEPDH